MGAADGVANRLSEKYPRVYWSLALFLAVLFSVAIKLVTGGWLVLILGIFYLSVCVIHVAVHLRTIFKLQGGTQALSKLIFISHVLLVGGFLLQVDFGDLNSWLTITFPLGAPPPLWWEDAALFMNVVVFLPVFFTWIALLS
jgi:hypothetical protein